jgi:hypothetical protein
MRISLGASRVLARARAVTLAVALVASLSLAAGASAAPPLSGAIFTTDSTCSGVDLNIYDSKDAVYLNGGPAHPGAATLPAGSYYVQVTTPAGDLLGTSVGSTDETPLVSDGTVVNCIQLSAVLKKASDDTIGYDDTTNPGGEYKVWASTVSTFDPASSKTDNFKVHEGETITPTYLRVRKYYDANANGAKDGSELYLDGWRFNIKDGINVDRDTPVDMQVEPDTYTVTEQKPSENNWINTDPYEPDAFINPASLPFASITLAPGDDKTVAFGNVCVGAGGGHTLGFWSNKNGQATMSDYGADGPELQMLRDASLRNANGSAFDPTTYAQFRTWLLSANAVNMAYMLSAQYAAMLLNVEAGFVSPLALAWNGSSFVTISSLLAAAETQLVANGSTPDGNANRSAQEQLKTTLDAANNNTNFVQATACPYTFAPLS